MNTPFRTKFAADVDDIIISGVSESKTFTLTKDGVSILQETYNYDSEGRIRITGLAQILSTALYGELKEGVQTHANALIGINVTGESAISREIYAMRLQNPDDPDGEKMVLAMAADGICYPGQPLLITVIGVVTVRLSRPGRTITTTDIGEAGTVTTVDCDPAKLFPNHYGAGSYMDIGSEIERIILPRPDDSLVTVRFLNRYDVPESLTALYMTEKPSVSDDVSMMYGRRVRFGVTSTTEYTLQSGQLRSEREYDTWQDLLTSRKAQLLWRGQWIDIIITKSNYTRQRRMFYNSKAEISFQTANPNLTL